MHVYRHTENNYKKILALFQSMKRLNIYVGILCVNMALAALPQEWESEYFCPAATCMRDIVREHGFSGPFSAFHECCLIGTDHIIHITTWGSNDQVSKQDLIQQGYHKNKCIEAECLATPTNHTRHRHTMGSDWYRATLMLAKTLPRHT